MQRRCVSEASGCVKTRYPRKGRVGFLFHASSVFAASIEAGRIVQAGSQWCENMVDPVFLKIIFNAFILNGLYFTLNWERNKLN